MCDNIKEELVSETDEYIDELFNPTEDVNKLIEYLDAIKISDADDSDKEDNNNEDLNENTELQKYFKSLDKMYFKEKLTENKVSVVFSNRLVKNWSRIVKPKEISHELMDRNRRLELHDHLVDSMIKSSQMIDRAIAKEMDKNIDQNADPYECERHEESNDCANDLHENDKQIEKPFKKDDYVSERAMSGRELRDKMDEIEKISLVDDILEELDPKPDINELFRVFDERYFEGKLRSNDVQVMWSYAMNRSAGITYHKFNDRPIIIRLSYKILRTAPRRHTVETLLHEMIHAWINIHDINDGKDGHGVVFHKKMHELNAKTKTHITVEHNLLVPDYNHNN
ncbi:unnamed protein product [Medioppia subpectinata]|uniref:SprT-like domain-containing protein n=1 Tax=Medioppia subpectinata TaxID=1979941 RepID=A0A7R9LJ30_9ACAR|nr:unnamed protein product [Medioppia subpectinata]CAG2119268.1 unnamed protein product [Medioppia subpectinata]